MAVFGGTVAVALVAVVNARRLRAGPLVIAAIAAAGAIGTAIAVAYTGRLEVSSRAVAVAVCAVQYLLQRRAERIHLFHCHEEEPQADLFAPGLAAVLLGVVAEYALYAVAQ